MPRPLVGNTPTLKRQVGQAVGWQTAIGPRVNDWEGAPTTGTSPDDKYLLPVSIQSLEGQANGTSTATGLLRALFPIQGTANGTSTASGNLISLVFVPLQGTLSGISTATADLDAVIPRSSPSEMVGGPREIHLVEVAAPATAVDEGIFFVSDGTGGLNAGEPYWRPESSGTPVSLYDKPYVEDLAETLIFGDFTGGSNIIVSNGDRILSENSGAGVPGRPVVLAPGTSVDTDVGALVWAPPSVYATLVRGKGSVDLQASGYDAYNAYRMAAADNNYTAIVGGKFNMIGAFVPGYSGAHYSGIFGGWRNRIVRNATHSVIIGGGTYGPGEGPLQNQIRPSTGQVGTHNAIVASYGGFIQADTQSTSFNFMHAVWDGYIYNTSYSALVASSGVELGRFSDTQQNIDVFVSGVFHDIWQPAGAVHGNIAMAVFGRLNDTYSATNGAMFGRFLRLGNTELSAGVHGSCIGGNSSRLNSDYTFSWGSCNWPNGGYVGAYSFQVGFDSDLNSSRQWAHSGNGSVTGTQRSEYPRHGTTTDATPLDITPTGLRINLASSISPTIGGTYGFEIVVVARQTGGVAGTVGDSAMWNIAGCIKYRPSTLTTTFVGVPTGTGTPSAFNDAGAAAWSVSVTADDTNETLVVTVTGEVDKTISWMARVHTNEIRGGI